MVGSLFVSVALSFLCSSFYYHSISQECVAYLSSRERSGIVNLLGPAMTRAMKAAQCTEHEHTKEGHESENIAEITSVKATCPQSLLSSLS